VYVVQKKIVKISPVVFELERGRKWKLCHNFSEIWRSSFIQHAGVPKWNGTSQFWFKPV